MPIKSFNIIINHTWFESHHLEESAVPIFSFTSLDMQPHRNTLPFMAVNIILQEGTKTYNWTLNYLIFLVFRSFQAEALRPNKQSQHLGFTEV